MSEHNNNNDNSESSTLDKQILKENLLKFCPNCGHIITWLEDLKYCINCGINLIQYIPKEKLHIWLNQDEPLTTDEINQLFIRKNNTFQNPSVYSPIYTPKYITRKPWGWLPALGVPILAFVAQIVVMIVLTFIFVLIIFPSIPINILDILNSPNFADIFLILGYISSFLFLLIPYGMTGYYLPVNASKKEKLNAIGIPVGKLDRNGFFKELIIGLVFALIMTGVVIGTQFLSALLTELIFGVSSEQLLSDDFDVILPNTIGYLIINILFMFISVGPTEEVLFRGFCQKGMENSMGKKPAWITTAFYFSIFHIIVYIFSPALFFFSFIPYMSISLILGYLYLWRKNVVASIFAHAMYNSIQFIMSFSYPDILQIIIIVFILNVIFSFIPFLIIKILDSRNSVEI